MNIELISVFIAMHINQFNFQVTKKNCKLYHNIQSSMTTSSGHEDDKEDEEEDENPEDLDHEPPVGGHRAEVLEDLLVRQLCVHCCLLHVAVDANL